MYILYDIMYIIHTYIYIYTHNYVCIYIYIYSDMCILYVDTCIFTLCVLMYDLYI